MAAKSPRCTRTPAALPCGYVMVRRAPLGPSAVEGVPGAGRLRMSGNQDAVRVHGVSRRSRVVPVAGERRFHHRTAACDCAASGRGQQTPLGDRSFRCHRITVTVTVEAVYQCGPPAVLYDQARVPTVCVVVGGDAATWPPLFTAMAIRTLFIARLDFALRSESAQRGLGPPTLAFEGDPSRSPRAVRIRRSRCRRHGRRHTESRSAHPATRNALATDPACRPAARRNLQRRRR